MTQDEPRKAVIDEKALSVGSKDASAGAPAQPAPEAPSVDREQLRSLWQAIETTAAADPQAALQQAQALVKQIADSLALQPSMKRYREFIERLLV